MKTSPLITIGVGTYNSANFLPTLIESILQQVYQNWELLIFDDCSTDNTEEVIQSYLDNAKITYISNKTNLGMEKNWKQIYTSGKGEYFIGLGGDDYLDPLYLSTLVPLMEKNSHVYLAYTPTFWVEETGTILKEMPHFGHKAQSYIGGRNEVADLLVFDNYITPSAALIRKSALNSLTVLIEPNMTGVNDWLMWIKIASTHPDFIFYKKSLVYYRIHENQYSAKFYQSIEPLEGHIKVIEKTIDLVDKSVLIQRKDDILQHLLRRYQQYKNNPEAQKLEPRIIAIQNALDAISPSLPKLNTKTPLVSVIITTYNRRELLPFAIDSVRNQTYPHFELIIVNDSGEDVSDIIESYHDERISLITHESNCGLSCARNTGIKKSSGTILSYLDDDDFYLQDHLETIVSAFVSSNAGVVFTDSIYRDETINDGVRTVVAESFPFKGIAYSKERIHIQNFIPVNAWSHRRETVDQIGYFDTSLVSMEDWEYLLRLSQYYDFHQVQKVTVDVRRRIDVKDNMLRQRRDQFYDIYRTLYEKYDNLGNHLVQQERDLILAGLLREKTALENPAVPVGYLNHPFEKSTGEHREETLHAAFSYLDEFRLQSVWINEGSEYSIDTNVIDQCKVILVHNRGALFNETIFKLRTLGKQIIYYMDNYLLELPIKHTLYPYYQALYPRITSMIEHSDACVTSSAYSASLLLDYPNVTSIDAGVNLHLWQLPIVKSPREDDKPIIAFFGDENDLEALTFIKPFLERLQQRYGDAIHIKIFGLNVETYKLMPFRNYEVLNLKIPSYPEWIRFLRAQNIDVILMPNRKDPYSQGISIGRALDFSLSNIPLVCSHTEPFTSFIDHGINGFLCEDALDQWMNAVESLLSSEALRTTFANQAFTKAITTLSAQHSAKKWRDLLNNLPAIESTPIEVTILEGMRWSKYQINSLERYPAWLDNRRFRPEDIHVWAKEAEKWTSLPSITLYIIADEETIGLLNYTIDSLANQLYPAWKLTLISVFPSPNPIFESHEQLRWICTEKNPYECIQNDIETDLSEWIIITDKADLFEPQAFASFIHIANTHPNTELIYCDHGLVSADNLLSEPQFKPDLNLDMLRAYDYVNGTFAVRKTLLSRIGGVSGRCPHAELYDLLLRTMNARADIVHIDDLLWHKRFRLSSPEEQQLQDVSRRLALMLHLQENGTTAQVISGSVPGTTRILYLHNQTPKVSIIIPTKNKIDYLRRCIESILTKTAYKHYEIIIVDNASDETEAIAYLDDLRHTQSSSVQIIPYNRPFNYSEANNLGVKAATGEILLFLNNDTEVLHENWLDVMVSHICRNEVGIVGPRLLFGDGKIQHAGVVLGMAGPAGHIFGLLSPNENGYMNRLQIEQNYSAVTGAALMIKRSVFDSVSGFNATDYLNHYSDIDLCLKVIDKGLKIVWTPHATLTHHESVSFKSDADSTLIEAKNTRFIQDQDAFIRIWNKHLECDPHYNRNLETSSTDALINIDDLPHWSLLTSSIPRIWAIPRGYDGGGEYRLISPMNGLNQAGLAQVHIGWNYYGYPFLINRHHPDTIVAQTPLHDHQIRFLETIQPYFNGNIIFEIDDLLTNIPKENAAYNRQYADIKDRLGRALKSCNRMIVSTEPLKQAYNQLIDDVQVVKNYLSLTRWEHITPKRFDSPKPRVGWAGSPFHAGDLKILENVIKTLKDDVHWVFMGMVPEGAKEYVHEFHPAVSLDEYPSKLAELGLDLALVPLELNPFNEAKSNLRLLELGIMGWPIICSDAYPYRSAPVTIVKNNDKEWIKAIKEKLSNREKMRFEGENLREWVIENFILEHDLESVLKGYI